MAPPINKAKFSWQMLIRDWPASTKKQLKPDLAPLLEKWGTMQVEYNKKLAELMALDLLVCVDTLSAHLAGALGVPTWLLLPLRADWRWMENREDTPWYPTMRLFRQNGCGDWSPVIARVARELRRRFN